MSFYDADEPNHIPEDVNLEEYIAHCELALSANKEKTDETLAEIDDFDDQIKALNKALEEIQARKSEVSKLKSALSGRRFDLSRERRQSEKDLAEAKRRLALRAAALLAEERMNARRESLDALLKDAAWIDRALPHQLEGMHYLSAAQRALCGDEMGTGKTLQSIMTLDALEAMGDSKGRILIIAPGELCSNFMMECDEWAPNRLVVSLANLGTARTLEDMAFWTGLQDSGAEDSLTFLINYEILARSDEVVKEIIAWQPDTVICDEAHRIKETDSKTFKGVRQIVHSHNACPECGGLTFPTHSSGLSYFNQVQYRRVECGKHGTVQGERSVKNFIAMTGTFFLNDPTDVFASLLLAREDLFPSFSEYTRQYADKNYKNRWVWKYGGESRLISKIQGMYIKRTIHDAGITLPPQKINVYDIDFDPVAYQKQAQLLEDLRLNAMMQIEEGIATSVNSILALITRQRQATVWPGGIYLSLHENPFDRQEVTRRVHVGANYQESQKLDWACEKMDEFERQGVRYAVMSLFREPLDALAQRRGENVVLFHGGTDRETRDQIKRNFNRVLVERGEETPKWDGVLAHYTLGGEGLNLTDITQMIILDEQWNPGKNEQAYKRIQRMGQTEDTAVHIPRMKGPGCLDLWMAALNESKRQVIDGFNNEYTFAELADVFKNL